MIDRAMVAACLVLAGCGGVVSASTPAHEVAITGAAVASASAEPDNDGLSRESRYLLARCYELVPGDIAEQAHLAVDETLFSALIDPCVEAGEAISQDIDHGVNADAVYRTVGDWLRTLMALDEDYDVKRSLLDDGSYERLNRDLAALAAVVAAL